jgi:hypothetical protein
MLIMPSIFCAAVGLEARCECPRVFLLNGESLLAARQRLSEGDKQLQPAYEALRRDADRALGAGPFSVVNKSAVPPSGDKHDYMSLAPYWWPNPGTKNGLPYIRRDGERNPDTYQLRNRSDLGSMADTLETLGLAYYFTGDEKYATRARLLIRTWFIEPETRMNPNFEFAQAIRGVNTGRGLGLIESRLFTKVVDAVRLLAGTPSWTTEDEREIEKWFSTFLNWMLSSEHGHDEANAKNNHGTYYDVQVASFALFIGKKELARQVVQEAKTKRIAVQIESDGRQPLELTRTKAWSYSVGNLSGLMSLARLGEHVDVLIPFSEGRKKWPYEQIGGFSRQATVPLVQQAAAHYPDGAYAALLSNNDPIGAESRSKLIYSDARH